MIRKRGLWALLLLFSGGSRADTIAAMTAATSVIPANAPTDCAALDLHGQRAQAQACYGALTHSADAYLRAEGIGVWVATRTPTANFALPWRASIAVPCIACAGAAAA